MGSYIGYNNLKMMNVLPDMLIENISKEEKKRTGKRIIDSVANFEPRGTR